MLARDVVAPTSRSPADGAWSALAPGAGYGRSLDRISALERFNRLVRGVHGEPARRSTIASHVTLIDRNWRGHRGATEAPPSFWLVGGLTLYSLH